MSYTSGGVGVIMSCSIWNKSVLRDSGQNFRFDLPGITPGIDNEVGVLIE